MVHFPGFASRSLLYSEADIPILLGISLQDSDIPGSQPVCGSPRLFAAYHVLPRLPSPRHPPYALSSLTIKFAPPEIFSNPKLLPFYGPLVFFFYPSFPDCQRSLPRLYRRQMVRQANHLFQAPAAKPTPRISAVAGPVPASFLICFKDGRATKKFHTRSARY